MSDMTNSFRIAVQIGREQAEEILKDMSTKSCCLILDKNHVVVRSNEDFDDNLSKDKENGFLYYKSNIDFYPKDDGLELVGQIQLAKEIRSLFVKQGIRAEIIAEFEELL